MAERDIAKINAKHLKDGDSFKDRIFNWIVTRYTEKGNEFGKSDKFIWQGTVYLVPTYVGYIAFIAAFMFLANITQERYGDTLTLVFFMLLLMWRVQKVGSKLDAIKEKL